MFGHAFRTLRTTLRATANTFLAAQPHSFNPASAVLSRGMANHRHKKVLKLAKGYRGRANRCFTVAKQRVDKARQYAYVGRKVRQNHASVEYVNKQPLFCSSLFFSCSHFSPVLTFCSFLLSPQFCHLHVCMSLPPSLRQLRKREFRTLWIQRLNASTRMYGTPYSLFINALNNCGPETQSPSPSSDVHLNRKVLADLAISEPLSFRSVLEVVKQDAASKKQQQQ